VEVLSLASQDFQQKVTESTYVVFAVLKRREKHLNQLLAKGKLPDHVAEALRSELPHERVLVCQKLIINIIDLLDVLTNRLD
jgi:hypothetical protein